LALKGIARAKGTDQKQAAGLTERDSLTIIDRTGSIVSIACVRSWPAPKRIWKS
jgi:hypothetical protein